MKNITKKYKKTSSKKSTISVLTSIFFVSLFIFSVFASYTSPKLVVAHSSSNQVGLVSQFNTSEDPTSRTDRTNPGPTTDPVGSPTSDTAAPSGGSGGSQTPTGIFNPDVLQPVYTGSGGAPYANNTGQTGVQVPYADPSLSPPSGGSGCDITTNGGMEDPNSGLFQLVHVCTGGKTISAPGSKKATCECTFPDVVAQIGLIIKFILYLATFYAIGVLVYAGFMYITSGGNPAKAEAAKGMFANIVVGMIFIICAYFIVVFIMDAFKLQDSYRLVGPGATQ